MPARKTTITKTTQAKLCKTASSSKTVYVGFTNNPERRAKEHAHNGMSGTMRIAKTMAGKQAEQRLLNINNTHSNKNTQATSNVNKGAHGFVYTITK